MKVLRIAHHGVVSAWRSRERALRARGDDVALISARRWNEGGQQVALDAAGDRFVRGIGTIGTHPNLFVYNPIALWRALGAKPDVLDLHEEPCALATAEILMLRALRRRRPPYLLYSAQNLDKHYPVPFRWFERWALRGAAGAYVCNSEAGDILERKGLPVASTLIPLGVDTEDFHPGPRSAPSAPGVVIGYVGRLEQHKGVDVLLRAVALHPGWLLRITGDGPERATLARLAAELGIADRVTFDGFASGTDLASRYRELDVVAVPSLPWPGWREQFCRVAVEAMASGVPVVGSRTGAIPDVLGEAGVLVEPGDPDALVRGIESAVDASQWPRLRDAGLERARLFTWETVARAQSELYRSVVDPHDGGARIAPHVVVVAYGAPDLLAAALSDLGGEYDVTIVDNSSSPDTARLAQSHGAHYIDPGRNLGFGAGVNVALASLAERGAENRDVLLLNPDARIDPSGIRRMHRLLHSGARIAAVGATQVDPVTGDPARVWWPFPHPVRAWLEAVGLGRLDRSKGFAIGSILLLRAEALIDVGLFDEQFFLYAEESDWQRRAVEAGWSIAVASVRASHVGGATSDDTQRRDEMFYASLERFVRKHHGRVGWSVFRSGMIVGAAMRGALLRDAAAAAARRRLALFVTGPVRSEDRSSRR